MDCPICGNEMKEEIRKIKAIHPFGKKANTLRNKSRKTYTYNCIDCSKQFVVSKVLVECKIAN